MPCADAACASIILPLRSPIHQRPTRRWTVGRLDGWTVGWLDGWTVGQSDGWTVGQGGPAGRQGAGGGNRTQGGEEGAAGAWGS
eukprot:1964618-Prymnesium_polylepis.3